MTGAPVQNAATTSTNDVTVYTATLVIPITAPPILGGAVAVRGGKIVHVGERAWVTESLAEQGVVAREVHHDGILMPGLVNAHSHLQYTGMAAVGQRQYNGFEDWAEAFNRDYVLPHDWYADAMAGAQSLLRAGTTSVADIVTDPTAIPVLHESGLHGITYWEVMSWTNEDWQERGRQLIVEELDRIPTTPGAGLSPHAPYSLDAIPLLDIPDIVRQRGLRTHLHLGEAAFEGERDGSDVDGDPWQMVKLESFRAMRSAGFGMSATEFVDQLGVLGPDCHVAHGVYMTASDRALLRKRGTSVALCPRSNEVIGLDAPPVAEYLVEGSPIAIGTDSLSSSPSLDLMHDVATLVEVARSQGYRGDDLHERILSAATLGGAHALGLDLGPDRTGYLAVGARADLAFFDVPVVSVADGIVALAEAGAGRASATMIGGELVWAADTTELEVSRG
ncbi:cytosine deaminase [Pseudoclavibacter sp. RFBJ3]|uniref:amidohydrolase family protein n=1 Tax=unclassified Pseudoclavibacter TaxID=2615177 RepID=UPI000CE7A82A|nr:MULTISPECIES: amidohydrolase family protein [unclassified Pseudoclavibacter]PPF84240.1 cytosine deaminase [Pseudoclavibacter sp. RFBJ5]PPF92859.1 cytosine deaminase [Pseudoclavibacter sp. RFBJ3]PPF98068.1 cytosine deaminase [Pseudoclavibacter sp. RFBH5]PPG25138.1 cytosine deaminase [Pseudoclavibacter sp. RFBI4]